MTAQLKKQYFLFLTPPVLAFAVLGGLEELQIFSPKPAPMQVFIAPAVFVAAMVCAVALPVWMRTLFAHRRRKRENASLEDFYRFQRRILLSALATPYLALAAFLLGLPPVHFYGTILTALYAVYYYYPSERRIQFDRKIFKIGSCNSRN